MKTSVSVMTVLTDSGENLCEAISAGVGKSTISDEKSQQSGVRGGSEPCRNGARWRGCLLSAGKGHRTVQVRKQ